jgi:hypothetical protein
MSRGMQALCVITAAVLVVTIKQTMFDTWGASIKEGVMYQASER